MINLGNDYDKVKPLQQGEYVKLPAGGYVCIVTNAVAGKSKGGSDMLTLSIDIAEGDFKAYFKNSQFPPQIYQNIFDKNKNVSPYFKGLIKNFELSNPGFFVGNGFFDEKLLINKRIGVIFGEVERLYNGKIYVDAKPSFTVPVAKIYSGDFKIPEIKRVDKPPPQAQPANSQSFTDDDFAGDEIPDDRVPF